MPPKKKRHCPFYQKMQRSVRDSFLCTGGEFWDPCSKFKVCLENERKHGVPEPWVPNAPKDKSESEKAA
jgi:hypothetical protein